MRGKLPAAREKPFTDRPITQIAASLHSRSRMGRLDMDALYARHGEELLMFLTRRTADPQIALDLWAEAFAQAVAGSRRFRGTTPEEADAWLYTIARRQLARYYERGRAEQRA